ncbi:hypothetical protein [Streptomyces sp. NPDC088923]|uniref:hypothetical protein n=1 Tax=Streptomyces sp. NPDC088923 TaxID=3365913 RepID=UPI003801AD2C
MNRLLRNSLTSLAAGVLAVGLAASPASAKTQKQTCNTGNMCHLVNSKFPGGTLHYTFDWPGGKKGDAKVGWNIQINDKVVKKGMTLYSDPPVRGTLRHLKKGKLRMIGMHFWGHETRITAKW